VPLRVDASTLGDTQLQTQIGSTQHNTTQNILPQSEIGLAKKEGAVQELFFVGLILLVILDS
jgi:hypothetical protein